MFCLSSLLGKHVSCSGDLIAQKFKEHAIGKRSLNGQGSIRFTEIYILERRIENSKMCERGA